MTSDAGATELQVFEGRRGLGVLLPGWAGLADRIQTRRFFHLPEWQEAAMDWLEESPESVRFFALGDRNMPDALCALKRRTMWVAGLPLRVWEPLQHPHISFSDILSVNADAGRALLEAVMTAVGSRGLAWDVIRLPRILDDSCAYQALRLFDPRRALAVPVARYGQLPLAPYDRMTEHFSKKRRQHQRTAWNRASRAGTVTFETARTGEELERAFPEFLRIESSGWKGEKGSAIEHNTRVTGFYRGLAESFAKRDACEIHLMRLDGKAIATEFCLVVNDTCYTVKTGYDEEYRNLSPGMLMMEYIVKRCYEDLSLVTVNLVTAASYMESWRPEFGELLNGYLFNRTVRGTLARRIFPLLRRGRQTHRSAAGTMQGLLRSISR
ncbi:MAG: GNAT family N-acetyltransferase [Lentisphaerae bacterium]|nr:GNAT family N-acetyltransferase [Lentisphaerota bacterium]